MFWLPGALVAAPALKVKAPVDLSSVKCVVDLLGEVGDPDMGGDGYARSR